MATEVQELGAKVVESPTNKKIIGPTGTAIFTQGSVKLMEMGHARGPPVSCLVILKARGLLG